MNDKELDRMLAATRERWRPYNEWKDRINERILRLEARTKVALAKAAYLKAHAEMRACQGAAAGRQGEMATPVALDGPEASDKGVRRGKRARGASE